ncbi:hypothetical protein PR048_004436 [Dryococelus australis]|uniref:Uncharacterized protein n=1 Tax=Dryococelus australis TaxID=614101 RepID=A0ABQ9I5G4_9NEOP|nr:hypothetical protein PR048_004436 [Dryococelus australis]
MPLVSGFSRASPISPFLALLHNHFASPSSAFKILLLKDIRTSAYFCVATSAANRQTVISSPCEALLYLLITAQLTHALYSIFATRSDRALSPVLEARSAAIMQTVNRITQLLAMWAAPWTRRGLEPATTTTSSSLLKPSTPRLSTLHNSTRRRLLLKWVATVPHTGVTILAGELGHHGGLRTGVGLMALHFAFVLCNLLCTQVHTAADTRCRLPTFNFNLNILNGLSPNILWLEFLVYVRPQMLWSQFRLTTRLPRRRTGFDLCGVAPRFSHVGIVPGDAASRRVPRGSAVSLPLRSGAALHSPRFTLVGSQDLDYGRCRGVDVEMDVSCPSTTEEKLWNYAQVYNRLTAHHRFAQVLWNYLRLPTTCGNLRLPATTRDYLRLPANTCEYSRLPATTCDYPRQLATICEYLRLLATTGTSDMCSLGPMGCCVLQLAPARLSGAVGGDPSLPPFFLERCARGRLPPFWEFREYRPRRDLLASQTSSRLLEFPISLAITQECSRETGQCPGPPRPARDSLTKASWPNACQRSEVWTTADYGTTADEVFEREWVRGCETDEEAYCADREPRTPATSDMRGNVRHNTHARIPASTRPVLEPVNFAAKKHRRTRSVFDPTKSVSKSDRQTTRPGLSSSDAIGAISGFQTPAGRKRRQRPGTWGELCLKGQAKLVGARTQPTTPGRGRMIRALAGRRRSGYNFGLAFRRTRVRFLLQAKPKIVPYHSVVSTNYFPIPAYLSNLLTCQF